MRLFIRLMTGKTTEINVSEDAGIRHVKWELESDLGIPSALQVLAGIGKNLEGVRLL